ncbi:MAG TPA: transcriptional regulator, partial [Flavobacterium sp.]|nr:transcriptional regulator [Flavobacterium sp.]
NLAQIVSAIDGETVFKSCGLGINHCSDERPCPLNKKFKSIRENLAKMLENTYLEELVFDINSGDSFLI